MTHLLEDKDLLHFLHFIQAQNNHARPAKLPPLIKPTPRQINHFAIDSFERRQGGGLGCDEFEAVTIDPTELALKCHNLLPKSFTILQMSETLSETYDNIKESLAILEYCKLATRRANSQHWPTPRGFFTLGLEPTSPPKNKGGAKC